jgi:hypothetical protein
MLHTTQKILNINADKLKVDCPLIFSIEGELVIEDFNRISNWEIVAAAKEATLIIIADSFASDCHHY